MKLLVFLNLCFACTPSLDLKEKPFEIVIAVEKNPSLVENFSKQIGPDDGPCGEKFVKLNTISLNSKKLVYLENDQKTELEINTDYLHQVKVYDKKGKHLKTITVPYGFVPYGLLVDGLAVYAPSFMDKNLHEVFDNGKLKTLRFPDNKPKNLLEFLRDKSQRPANIPVDEESEMVFTDSTKNHWLVVPQPCT